MDRTCYPPIHSTANVGEQTTSWPSVESNLVYATGEFHYYTGQFDPFDDEDEENVEGQYRRPFAVEHPIEPSLIDHEHVFGDSRPPPHLTAIPSYDAAQVIPEPIAFQPTSLLDHLRANTNTFENPRPAPQPWMALPSCDAVGFIFPDASTADMSSAGAAREEPSFPKFLSRELFVEKELTSERKRQDSVESIALTATPIPRSPQPQQVDQLYSTADERGRESLRNTFRKGSRDLSPRSIITADGRRVRVTDIYARDAYMAMLYTSWNRNSKLRRGPRARHDRSPLRITQSSALADLPPTFTNPFDGNKKIEFRQTVTPSGLAGVVYSTDRAWHSSDVPKFAERQTKRIHFGSDEDEIYVPLGRVGALEVF
ncbi:hypothetical protein J3R30DRAFT_560188 [Lentinula aciculospora]|uniref:Uncharacterized protein n=1 Tax=Lentinula aciculospora TaxID=153920 RepID=A0A9W9DM33_9AGAR|nr:hypothetical protein J3R30DRAFT_560188 [Lentinula aciculospora]